MTENEDIVYLVHESIMDFENVIAVCTTPMHVIEAINARKSMVATDCDPEYSVKTSLLNKVYDPTEDMFKPLDTFKPLTHTAIQEESYPVRAHWIHKVDEDGNQICVCSKCNEESDISSFDWYYRGRKVRPADSAFCPNCGARMDGKEDE